MCVAYSVLMTCVMIDVINTHCVSGECVVSLCIHTVCKACVTHVTLITHMTTVT